MYEHTHITLCVRVSTSGLAVGDRFSGPCKSLLPCWFPKAVPVPMVVRVPLVACLLLLWLQVSVAVCEIGFCYSARRIPLLPAPGLFRSLHQAPRNTRALRHPAGAACSHLGQDSVRELVELLEHSGMVGCRLQC